MLKLVYLFLLLSVIYSDAFTLSDPEFPDRIVKTNYKDFNCKGIIVGYDIYSECNLVCRVYTNRTHYALYYNQNSDSKPNWIHCNNAESEPELGQFGMCYNSTNDGSYIASRYINMKPYFEETYGGISYFDKNCSHSLGYTASLEKYNICLYTEKDYYHYYTFNDNILEKYLCKDPNCKNNCTLSKEEESIYTFNQCRRNDYGQEEGTENGAEFYYELVKYPKLTPLPHQTPSPPNATATTSSTKNNEENQFSKKDHIGSSSSSSSSSSYKLQGSLYLLFALLMLHIFK